MGGKLILWSRMGLGVALSALLFIGCDRTDESGRTENADRSVPSGSSTQPADGHKITVDAPHTKVDVDVPKDGGVPRVHVDVK